MFRRVVATAPAAAGKLVSSAAARPQIASPLRTALPATGAVIARRSYHEKDE